MLATVSSILSFEIKLNLFDKDVISTPRFRQFVAQWPGGGSIEISYRYLLDFLCYANQESYKYKIIG
jgi:hypothetical protein